MSPSTGDPLIVVCFLICLVMMGYFDSINDKIGVVLAGTGTLVGATYLLVRYV